MCALIMDVVRGAVFKQKRVVGFKCARHTHSKYTQIRFIRKCGLVGATRDGKPHQYLLLRNKHYKIKNIIYYCRLPNI